jgi:predicted Fe-Mo cluster-binding NifX family protein
MVMTDLLSTVVALPSVSPGGLDAPIHARFGRCDCFTVVAIENGVVGEAKVIPNAAQGVGGGAGPMSAQTIVNAGAKIVAGGMFGFNAQTALEAAGVKIITLPPEKMSGTVRTIVDLLIQGQLD